MINPLTPDHLRVAIVMMRRAQCSGDEARNVADAIDVFDALYTIMVNAQRSDKKVAPQLLEVDDGDDKELSQ